MKAEDEAIPVIDLTEAEESTEADREAVLAEALAHAATQEAQYRQPLPETKRTGIWKVPLALVVFALSTYLLAFPPPWLSGDRLPTLSEQDRQLGTHAAIYLQAQQVEAFRVKRGRLPGSLQELDAPMPNIEFIRSNNRVFQLVTPGPSGSSVVYDSTRPTEDFLRAVAGWAGR